MTGALPPARPQAGLDARTESLLRRLVRRDAGGALKKLLARTRPEDIAAAMEHLTWTEQRRLYRTIEDRSFAASVLAHLSDSASREVTRDLSSDAVVRLLEHMDPDDATDVVAVLPTDLQAEVLGQLRDEATGEEVKNLLAWPPESAGGLMSSQVFRQPEDATCGQAIAALQASHEELETIYYLYAVDTVGRLVGVTSLRNLLTHPPKTPLAKVVVRDPISVSPTTDQEEVARIVARYDLLAVPVVDAVGRILGIVTVDDVVDVIQDEAAEDMMLMAGVSEAEPSLWRQAAYRAGWLLATIAGGIVASEVIGLYEETLAAKAMLAGFIPVIMGMGGNVGIQSATLAVRGLATGRVQVGGAAPFLWRETRVGLILGAFYAVLLSGYGLLRFTSDPLIGVSVGISIFLAILAAGGIGAGLPLLFQRVGADPAVSTGPFVTTLVDLLGIVIYFNVARALLDL